MPDSYGPTHSLLLLLLLFLILIFLLLFLFRVGGAGVGNSEGGLRRHFGLWQATALNVTMIVGAGVFITIPMMLEKMPSPLALLGWLAGGVLILLDSLVWSELGAALPGSGGSYLYLLECYGRQRWGRLMAFLFIWQFLLSGPLEIASGLIAMDAFAQSLSPAFQQFNLARTLRLDLWPQQQVYLTVSPARLGCVALGGILIALLYRRVNVLGRLTVLMWLCVLGAIAWICLEGFLHFEPARVFEGMETPVGNWSAALGGTMLLALYSYVGYYNICHVGDEVRDPGRTIPRAILLSSVLVCVLFVALHLAMLGTVSWREALEGRTRLKDEYSLPADFMGRLHGPWAVQLVTVLLMGSCFGAAFAGLLGYSRIPYGAARAGHFFQVVAHVHPRHRIPHVALLLVGGLTLLWSFFDLQNVIGALLGSRILMQFAAQIVGVFLLRRAQPERSRPFRIWLAPLPCGLALAGFLYVYAAMEWKFIAGSLLTLAAGLAAFLLWSRRLGEWPFGKIKA
jgi:APA family basic amino acid/polyamine antiporter